jgi:curved DNA-binding protein CbpA
MNFYAILGIAPDADDSAIRLAYRTLARRYHPDAGAGSSPEKFRQITTAYETLIDAARRRAYDASLRPRAVPVRSGVPVEPLGSYVEPLGPYARPLAGRSWNLESRRLEAIFEEFLRILHDDWF